MDNLDFSEYTFESLNIQKVVAKKVLLRNNIQIK